MAEAVYGVERLRDDPAVTAMLERICEITTMGFAAVARVTDSQWIACQVIDRIEFGLEPGDELVLKTTICNEIRQNNQAVVIDTVAGNPDWRTHPTPMLYGFESYISFPVRLPDGRFFGTLCAIDPSSRPIGTPAIAQLFERFAAEIGALLG